MDSKLFAGNFFKSLIASAVILNLVVIGTAVWSIWHSRLQAEHQAILMAQSYSNILVENIGDTGDKADMIARVAVDEIERAIAQGKPDESKLSAFLGRLQQRTPLMDALRATNAQGDAIYGLGVPKNPRINLSDRDYFIALRDNPNAGLVISRPNFGRITKEWGLIFARRINNPDGSFAGVAFARVNLSNFQKLFAKVNIGKNGAINLRDLSGRLITRAPVPADIAKIIGSTNLSKEYRQRIEAREKLGTYYTPASFDGVPRMVAFQQIDAYPFYLGVGLAESDYLADWKREAIAISGFVLVFALTSIVGMVVIGRFWRRQLHAAEVLAHEEEKFHTVADFTYDWEYWEGSGREILYMAPACERVTGYSAEEFVKAPELLEHIVHPDDLRLMEEHRHDATHENLAEVTYRIIRRDGQIVWITHGCKAVYGKNGQFLGRRVCNRDDTARKKLEIATKRFENIVQSSNDAIISKTLDGIVTSWNPGAEAVFGYSADEMIGQSMIKLFPAEQLNEEKLILERIRNGEVVDHFETLRIHKSGRLIDVSVTISPIHDETGKIIGASKVARDITEQRRIEAIIANNQKMLNEAQHIAHLGSWEWDLVTDTLSWSEEAAEMLVPDCKDTPPSFELFLHALHQDDRERVQAAVMDSIERDKPYDIDYRMVSKTRGERYVHAQGKIFRDDKGQAIRFVGTVLDITDRKLIEQELLRSNTELEQFSYGLSHDMRQPLRMIASHLKLIEMDIGDQLQEEQRVNFQYAIDGAKRLDKMLVGLLEYSRVGRKGEPPVWVESRALLDEALLFLQPAIVEAQAKVQIDGEWPSIFVSPDEMLRLIQNLIGNAVKYRIAERTPEITVAGEIAGNEWRLSVSDNGVGIPPDQIGRLFQVFQRLQSRTAYEGTGIGLAFCRKVAERHGGYIVAESEGEGTGSRFRVSIPIKSGCAIPENTAQEVGSENLNG